MKAKGKTLHSSYSTFPPPPPPPTTSLKPKSRRRLAILASIVTVVIVVAFISYYFFLRPQTHAWLFKGAYATYQGVTTQSLLPLNATIRIDILDYNDAQAEIHFFFKVVTRMGTLVTESQNTTWVDLDKLQSFFTGGQLTKTSEDYVLIEGFGVKHCVIYEYSSGGNQFTVYMEKELNWPVKFSIVGTQASDMFGNMDINLNLVSTNISALD